MLVISTRELTQNQNKYFEKVKSERVIIKRRNLFFQLVNLGETIPELDDSVVSKEEMYAKIDKGIEEYRQGKAKTLKAEDINSFLGLL
jgi:hypothetical protein